MKTAIEKQSIRVVMADDHVLLRDALVNLINGFDDCRVTGVADDGIQLLELLKKQPAPDVLILDLNMPRMDGFEAAYQVYKKYPDINILILTMYDSEIALIRLLQVGVKGFLKKDIHPSDLRRALVSVAEGGYYYSHQATGKLANLFQKNHANQTSIDRALLNEMEIRFLKLASTDMTYKEIAAQMHMTPRAVDGLRDALFEKLDVKSRVGLAIYAVKNGIVTF
ncbi:MAG TPA: response regulator transcription factor [Ferruginibacter sp.]|nr:response regulator transcription factor [Ferruginibacter sp.]